MIEQYVIEQLVNQVRDYAQKSANEVARGVETPQLAARLLQKYGRGIADTVSIICDNRRAADPIYEVLDKETGQIDPNWRRRYQEQDPTS